MNHKTFTKKDFAAGMRCVKSLYLNHHPEIAMPDSESNSLAIMEAGKAFELSVRDLIAPNGIDLTEVEDNQDKRIERTKRELRKKNCILYQATFQNDSGEFCMTDILIKKGNHIQIIEVKSVTKINEENYYDAAFQYQVITSSGVTVDEFIICYVNKDYIMKESLTSDIFIMEDVTKLIKKIQPRIRKNIERFKKVLDRKDIFEKEIGEFCFKPSPCEYQKYCMQGLPANNVFQFRSMHLTKQLNLHYSGCTKMHDAVASNRVKLTDGQIIQATCALENKTVIQYDKLREWLDQFKYYNGSGILYLDFESVNPLVPKIGQKSLTGLKPYTPVPIQYSLHYKCKKSNNKLLHMDYVADPDLGDPREEFFLPWLVTFPNHDTPPWLAFSANHPLLSDITIHPGE